MGHKVSRMHAQQAFGVAKGASPHVQHNAAKQFVPPNLPFQLIQHTPSN